MVELESEDGDRSRAPSGDTRSLRRALARLGTELERHRRQPQGEDLDLDAAVDSYVDSRAGGFSDDAVYVESQRSRRDLSALVLLDISGSAGEQSRSGGIVHDHQVSAAGDLHGGVARGGGSGRPLRVSLAGAFRGAHSPLEAIRRWSLDSDRGPAGRTAPRRFYPARSSDPPRHLDLGAGRWNRPTSAGSPVRRIRGTTTATKGRTVRQTPDVDSPRLAIVASGACA